MKAEPVSTLHWYKVGFTTELTRTQEQEIAARLLPLVQYSENRFKSVVVAGKIGEEQVMDFSPKTIEGLTGRLEEDEDGR